MSGRTVFLSYADDRFQDGQASLAASAKCVGFDQVISASPRDWHGTEFASANKSTLSQKRGGGYWLWKPWIIRKKLCELSTGDILFYCDASIDGFYKFDKFPRSLVHLASTSDQGFLIGPVIHQHGPLKHWTKRDALILMNCDSPDIIDRPLVQATWSVWRVCANSHRFLSQWLEYCCDPRILTDIASTLSPEMHYFKDHRHDQSVLTLLAYRDNWDVLDLESTGIFRIMSYRPQALITHRFLKAPRNADALLAREWPLKQFVLEAVKELFSRRSRSR